MGIARLGPLASSAVCLGVAVLTIGVGALLFAWSGVYNVAASSGHWAITRWFLEFGMRRSVGTQSLLVSVPRLVDENQVRMGAGHYQGGCASCHGAPGVRQNVIVTRMLPEPPSLIGHVPTWSDRELFWIVKHGLKYTGMPAWAAQGRDDEVWAVVAFLRELSGLSAERYQELAFGNTREREITGAQIAQLGPATAALAACARCHGDEESGPTSSLVPRLVGQTTQYLVASLKAYASGERASGIMQPVATELSDQDIEKLAAYYATLERKPEAGASPSAAPPEVIARGRQLAESGAVEQAIPPCLACHDQKATPAFPRLDGQSRDYLASQMRLWQRGLRMQTSEGAIMAPIAKRMTERQIDDVAAYFASREPMSADQSASTQADADGGGR
jgi:cytochrome c553